MTTYSRQQIVDRLAGKGFRPACEACGQDNPTWTVPSGSSSDEPLLMSMIQGDGGVTVSGLEVVAFVPMICNHCGYTRTYSLEYLMKGV